MDSNTAIPSCALDPSGNKEAADTQRNPLGRGQPSLTIAAYEDTLSDDIASRLSQFLKPQAKKP